MTQRTCTTCAMTDDRYHALQRVAAAALKAAQIRLHVLAKNGLIDGSEYLKRRSQVGRVNSLPTKVRKCA